MVAALTDLVDGGQYVACGQERFRPAPYATVLPALSPEKRKEHSKVFFFISFVSSKYRPSTCRRCTVSCGRDELSRCWLTTPNPLCTSCLFSVWLMHSVMRNGDAFGRGIRVLLNRRTGQTLEQVGAHSSPVPAVLGRAVPTANLARFCNQSVNDCRSWTGLPARSCRCLALSALFFCYADRAHRQICALDGREMALADLEDGQQYVAVGLAPFKRISYAVAGPARPRPRMLPPLQLYAARFSDLAVSRQARNKLVASSRFGYISHAPITTSSCQAAACSR